MKILKTLKEAREAKEKVKQHLSTWLGEGGVSIGLSKKIVCHHGVDTDCYIVAIRINKKADEPILKKEIKEIGGKYPIEVVVISDIKPLGGA